MVELLEYSAIFQNHNAICFYNTHYDSFPNLQLTNNDNLKLDEEKAKRKKRSKTS